MSNSKAQTLAHDPNDGEVDPRTYPIICCVKFRTEKVGEEKRLHELNRLTRVIDEICTEEGEPKGRIHYTLTPGIEGSERVEVRIQPCTTPEDQEGRLMEGVRMRVDDIAEAGKEKGWTVITD